MRAAAAARPTRSVTHPCRAAVPDLAVSERSYLAISENHDVGQDDYTLDAPLTVGLGS